MEDQKVFKRSVHLVAMRYTLTVFLIAIFVGVVVSMLGLILGTSLVKTLILSLPVIIPNGPPGGLSIKSMMQLATLLGLVVKYLFFLAPALLALWFVTKHFAKTFNKKYQSSVERDEIFQVSVIYFTFIVAIFTFVVPMNSVGGFLLLNNGLGGVLYAILFYLASGKYLLDWSTLSMENETSNVAMVSQEATKENHLTDSYSLVKLLRFRTSRSTIIFVSIMIIAGILFSKFVGKGQIGVSPVLPADHGVSQQGASAMNDLGSHYITDTVDVYFSRKVIPDADPVTFQVFPDKDYTKDKNHVYYRRVIIEDADPVTFEVLSLARDGYHYARDVNHVYVFGNVIRGVEPESFLALNNNGYIKDKNNVYFADPDADNAHFAGSFKVLDGADPAIFEYLGDYYAKSKNNIYYKNTILKYADAASFTTFNGVKVRGLAKDEDHVYFRGSIIDGADPTTFDPETYKVPYQPVVISY